MGHRHHLRVAGHFGPVHVQQRGAQVRDQRGPVGRLHKSRARVEAWNPEPDAQKEGVSCTSSKTAGNRRPCRSSRPSGEIDVASLRLIPSNHHLQWVTRWLDDVGLPQYKDSFLEARVDGRVLNFLTVDDLFQLKVTNQLHHLSLRRGIQVT